MIADRSPAPANSAPPPPATSSAALPVPFPNARHGAVMTVLFLVFVIYGSLVPLTFQNRSIGDAQSAYAEAMARGLTFDSRSDWAANVLLFIPLGFLSAATFCIDRRDRKHVAVALIPAMALLSASIEFVQLWFPPRNTALNDVVAETIGGAIGVAGWFMVGPSLVRRIRAVWSQLGPHGFAVKLFPVYLAFLVLVNGMPFDLSISPTELAQKYRQGRFGITPPTGDMLEKTLQAIAYFGPIGWLFAHWPGRRFRGADAGINVFLGGFSVALVIEAIQAAVLSCGCYASDVLTGSAAVAAVWYVSARGRLTVTHRRLALFVWAAGMAAINWAPDWFRQWRSATDGWAAVEWVPFADYYQADYLSAFNKIAHRIVLAVPVGLLAVRFGGQWWIGAATGTTVALIGECGQLFIPDRVPAVSDVIIGLIGGAIGGRLGASLPQVTSTAVEATTVPATGWMLPTGRGWMR